MPDWHSVSVPVPVPVPDWHVVTCVLQDGVEGNPLVRSISKQTDILHLAGPTAQKVREPS